MGAFLDKIIRRLSLELGVRLHEVERSIAARTLPNFATTPKGLVIDLPREIDHAEHIYLGDDVKLGPNSVLRTKVDNPGSWLRHPEGDHVEQTFSPRLTIGNRVTATSGLQITAFDSVTIEDDVMFASNVFIADGTHGTGRGDRPYKYQGIDRISPITIGRGSWIGQNVVVFPGVTIGEYTVVGANSVVTESIPAGSVAVGAPARVVRTWDGQAWQSPRASSASSDARS